MPNLTLQVKEYNKNLKGYVEIDKKEYPLDNTLKDEIINLDLSKDNKIMRYFIKEKSNLRVVPPCSIYGKCGGCSLLHINYNEQLRLKTELVSNLFLETYNKIYQVNDCIGMAKPEHYRNKNQVVFNNQGNKIICGFYEENTHKVVDFKECYIQDEISDKIVLTIRELLEKMHYRAYDEDRHNGLIRHVLIKRSKTTKEVMVVIVTGSEIFPGSNNFVKALTSRHREITTIIQNVNSRNTSAVLGEKEKILFGKGYINDILLNNKFKISAKSFYQINSEQCAKLYEKAIELAKLTQDDVVLDAYCGVGTIGISLANKVKKVIGVEIVKDAVQDAIINSKVNNIKNIHFFNADASDFIKNLAKKNEKIDVVVMDPPRSGSDIKFINAVNRLNPRKIIYISCNPFTLVEDIKPFLDNYKIKVIQPVDMFPHTNSVETIVCFERK